jgi:CheY-like chemotaxis protein
VSETAGLLSAAMPRDLALECDLPETLLRVRGNESALGRAVMNLATNARDAVAESDTSHVRITVNRRSGPLDDSAAEGHGNERTEMDSELEGVGPVQLLTLADGRHQMRIGQLDHPGGTIEVSVADDGCGIAPEKLERVLEPFYTTKTVGKGTGLGLSAVSGIALSHGGGLTITTAVGRGTVVTMHLAELPANGPRQADQPINAGSTAQSPPAQSAETTAAAEPDTSSGRHIVLIVDDEQTVAQMTADSVRRLGHTALTTTSASQALDLVRARHGEIAHLVTDLNMPEMTGSDLAQAVKQIDGAIPVTLISGHTLSAAADGTATVDHVLEKPIVRQKLAEILGPNRGNGQAPA